MASAYLACHFLCLLLISCAAEEVKIVQTTPQGDVNGVRKDLETSPFNLINKMDVFHGIPFAEPPIGEYRFKRSVPFEEQPGTVINENSANNVCMQTVHWFLYVVTPRRQMFQSEDCLYLDVYSPVEDVTDVKYPVLVYIHGGSFQVGGRVLFDGSMLASLKMVVVVINYRLGPFGFLGDGVDYPGNNGIHDQLLALQWVQKYIGHYRGDANEVLLMGHSAGAWSVGIHMLWPLSKGLFGSAIMQSGSILSRMAWQTRENFEMNFEGFLSSMDCLDAKSCLNNSSAADILDIAGFITSLPWIDGDILTDTPENMLLNGKVNYVPVLLGTTDHEWARFITTMKESIPDNWLYSTEPTDNVPELGEMIYEALVTGMEKDWPNEYMETIIRLVQYEYTNYNLPVNSIANRDLFLQIFSDMFATAPTERLASLLSSGDGRPSVYVYRFLGKLPVDAEGVEEYSWLSEYSYHEVDLPFTFGAPFSGEHMSSTWFTGNYTDAHRLTSQTQMGIISTFIQNFTPMHPDFMIGQWESYNHITKPITYINKGAFLLRYNFRAKRMYFWNELYPNLEEAAEGRNDNPTMPVAQGSDMVPSWSLYTCIGIIGLLAVFVVLFALLSVRKRRTDAA